MPSLQWASGLPIRHGAMSPIAWNLESISSR